MKKLTLKRNYKYVLFFIFLVILSWIFSDTRIISYNFWRYVTQLEIKKNNIENEIAIFDENILHDIELNISEEDYKNMILYYIKNDEKQYIKTNITIDGKFIENVWLKLKWSALLSYNLEEVDFNNIDFSFLVKFDKYNSEQTYLWFSEVAIISWTLEDIKWEYIASKLFNNFWILSSQSSFANVQIWNNSNQKYLLKEVINEEFLTDRYQDSKWLLYKSENSMSFTYLWEDPISYADLFTQKTLINNYDLKKLIEVLQFVSNADNDEIKLNLNKYIDIENYAKFLAINNYLYSDNKKIGLLNSYYMYFDLSTQTIKFIPWDAKYIYSLEETSMYNILRKLYSQQEITQLSKKDIRELFWTLTNTIPSDLKSKFKNDLEDNFLDKDTFKDFYEEIENEIIQQIESQNYIENLENNINQLLTS